MNERALADEAADSLALSEDLQRVLHRLGRQLRRENQELAISPLHLLLLVAIRKNPGIGVGELARLEHVRGPTITGHVKTLTGLGLVGLGPPDPEDRRRVGLVVTEKGPAVS